MEKYMDTTLSPKERAQALLEKLSLEEKMAQVTGTLVMPGMEEKAAGQFQNGIGEVSALVSAACETKEDAVKWQSNLQKMIMEENRYHIPAIFHSEGLAGALVAGSESFPLEINRGASFDPELERKIGEIISRQIAACGYTHVFAPVLDLTKDARFGRMGEAYGEDPTLVAAMGTAYTKGIQEIETDGRHLEAVAKHFLAYHECMGGINATSAQVSERQLQELHAKPFQAAIRDGKLRGIMPCYCSLNDLPVHASRKYLTDLLRKDMGFDGVIASDYGAVNHVYTRQHVCENQAEAGARCLKAGTDLELPMAACYGAELREKFEKGEEDIAILDQAVLRMLEAKFRMGLFEHPYALGGESLQKNMHHGNEKTVSMQAAQESIILLKNDGILPLKDEKKTIALIGPQAVNAGFYFGGYTRLSMLEGSLATANAMAGVGAGGDTSAMQMQCVPGTNIQEDDTEEFHQILKKVHPDCRNLFEVLKEQLPSAHIRHAKGYHKAGADQSLFAEALEVVKTADLVILTLGGKCGSGSIATMGEGVDTTDINLPECQDAFIREVHKLGKPVIGVHFDGKPISSDVADECLDAIIEAFEPGEYGAEAVSNVLTGAYNPSGKLPVCVAYNAGQIQVYYNHPNGSCWHQGESVGFANYVNTPHTPRYYFGHGLSYTDFAYRDLLLDKKEVTPGEAVKVSCTIENTGTVKGTETVQLYLKDVSASMTRPVMELGGFVRADLLPGEKKTVEFQFDPGILAFLDEDMRWKIEKGEIQVLIGASSEDIRLQDSFMITEDLWIQGKDRMLVADGKVAELT